jgi:hypothetical protein
MTQLSRLSKLGLGVETVPGVYVPPTVSIPFTKCDFEDVIGQIKDESFRNNDTTLQGMYPGPTHATWSIDVMAYPDLTGHWLRGIVGPDTVTPGITTTLAAATAVGDKEFRSTASMPAGSSVQIGTGAGAEFAVTGPSTGTGPYTIPVVTPAGGLTKVHAVAEAVATATVHTFKQDPDPTKKRTFSLTVDDTTNNPLGYTSATMSDLGIKIDPKGAITVAAKLLAMPGLGQEGFVPSFVKQPPLLGWQWTFRNAGSAATRGLSLDYTIKRAIEAVHSATGVQGPREIFQGALDADFSYKAIFENQDDLDLYLTYDQQGAVTTVTQPPNLGGCSLTLTMSKSGLHKGKREIGSSYVQASFSGSGIYNTTDGGALSATLTNYVNTVY